VTKAQQGKLRELQTAQMTVAEIAETMNMKKSDVRKGLVAMGYVPIETKQPAESEFLKGFKPVEIPKRSYRRITPDVERRICELREQCFTCEQIKNKLNICSSESVRQILIKNGYSTKRGEFHKIKATSINKDFDAAIDQMIEEAEVQKEEKEVIIAEALKDEKEPATAAAVTDSVEKQEITPIIPDNNHTTSEPESQPLSGVAALNLMQTMISDWTGMAANIVSLFADKDVAELVFIFEGKEYLCQFGQKGVPEYDGTP
jgi:hypothetical protein